MSTISIFGRLAVALLALVMLRSEVAAQDDASEFICPVGGEKFRQNVVMNYYPLEVLPNGSSPGGEHSDRMVPICPGNGLVMVPKYDGRDGDPEALTEYSPDEIARLPALIAGAEYRALASEAAYLRLYWLAGKLGRPAMQRFHLLQHVSWVGNPPEQHRANLERFVREADALIDAPNMDAEYRLRGKYIIANAFRELGRFDAAKVRLLALSMESQNVASKNEDNPHFESDSNVGDSWKERITSLLDAIERSDNDYFPVSMMGDKWARHVCGKLDDSFPPATEMTKRGCAKREADKVRAEKLWKEVFALSDDRAKRDSVCKSTPAAKRGDVLMHACEQADNEAKRAQIDAEATQLLENPLMLDARCKGLVIPRYAQPRTGLGAACQKRAEAVREQKIATLAESMRKQPSEYDRLCHWEYPYGGSDDPVELACHTIQTERDREEEEREHVRIDKMTVTQIETECAATQGDPKARSFTIAFRCEEIAWQKLQADPDKLNALCERNSAAETEWLQSRCSSYNHERLNTAARELAKDSEKLLATCKATPHPQRDEVLAIACEYYRQGGPKDVDRSSPE